MEGALSDYYDIHKKLPDGVIIYRQGISGGQKKYLKTEISQLQKIFAGESENRHLKGMKIKYYYVLVNKKCSLKFFEEDTYNMKNRNTDKGMYMLWDLDSIKHIHMAENDSAKMMEIYMSYTDE